MSKSTERYGVFIHLKDFIDYIQRGAVVAALVGKRCAVQFVVVFQIVVM